MNVKEPHTRSSPKYNIGKRNDEKPRTIYNEREKERHGAINK